MTIHYLGTGLFALALIHTFCVSFFAKLSRARPQDSAAGAVFHLLAEVEVVFGFWAFIFLFIWGLIEGPATVMTYQQSLNMTEPLFIFCIMVMAATKPVVAVARSLILFLSFNLAKRIPVTPIKIQFFVLLTVGPLLGSLITEPAAITIVALLLSLMIDEDQIDSGLLYGVLALLFVNISVGGALTHFAAPPILVVARVWNWGLKEVFQNLGEAATLSVFLNTTLFTWFNRKQLDVMLKPLVAQNEWMPSWVPVIHLLFLAALVATAHHPQVFMGIFLMFMGLTTVTKKYQDDLKFRDALLVAFFLAGLIVFGFFQKWWLDPVIQGLSEQALYFGAIGLTAITDNAALTYLGSQVVSMAESSKWALVSGALVGGGLTILANAPNPAGFSILSAKFPGQSLNATKLLLAALPWTVMATVCFLVLGKF